MPSEFALESLWLSYAHVQEKLRPWPWLPLCCLQQRPSSAGSVTIRNRPLRCNFEVCASLWASMGVIAVRPPCQSVDSVGIRRVTLFPMPVPWGNRCANSRLSFATMSAPKNMSLPVLQGSVKNLATRFQRFVHIGFKLISKYDMI